MKYFIMDAFAEEVFSGNPAGVVWLKNEDFPADRIMQQTAAELRFSETAFIRRDDDGMFWTRYFTPLIEVDLCGHATIGAFGALLRAGIVESGARYGNTTNAGVLHVEMIGNTAAMEMGEPTFVGRLDALRETGQVTERELYEILGLEIEEYHMTDCSGKRVQLVSEILSTGLPDILLPVSDEDALASIRPDFPRLAEFCVEVGTVGVHAYATRPCDGGMYVRNFAPACGIDEESATGTSNAALAYGLYRHNVIEAGVPVHFFQGQAMGRPSLIECIVETSESRDMVKVGGPAVMLAEGEIYL
jgi:PhzF family phenazine biosynthesis protein